MNYNEFYSQVGNLLYSISASDGDIRQKEIGAIKNIVKEKLLKIEDSEDEFGTDAAYFTEFRFDYCIDNLVDPNDAYADFLEFFKENSNSIKKPLRTFLLKISEEVAASFGGINKPEHLFLKKLEKDLSYTSN
jgi:hypothetical protein